MRLTLALAAIGALVPARRAVADPVWFTSPVNGHQYGLTTPASWHDARAEAISFSGDLVTVRSAAEDAWLQTTFLSIDLQKVWIGFTDEAVEGQWVWVSGEPVTYTNWYPGEPNDWPSSPQGEDYASYFFPWNQQWLDYPSPFYGDYPVLFPGIVEVVPAPPTACLLLAGNLLARRRR